MNSFRCGHPRTPENSIKSGRSKACRFCSRMRRMVAGNQERQDRINAGLSVDGRRVGKLARAWL